MGEVINFLQKVETKNEAEKKAEEGGEKAAADGGAKTDEGPITVVLKLDLHCEGCAKKVRRSVSHFEGVEKVKAECEAKRLTVTGNLDPAWLRERVETKTKKKVELISPHPPKDGGGGGAADTKAEEKPEKKIAEEKKAPDDSEKPKEAAVSTVVMKIKLHCDGCANKIKRVILKNVNGANRVTTDLEKHLVTVIGTMDTNKLTTYLKEKLKRGVEIVPPKKDDHASNQNVKEVGGGEKEKGGSGGGAGEEKKDKEGGKSGGGGDEKKEGGGNKKDDESKRDGGGEGSKGNEGTKVEVNKMEYNSFNPHTYYAMPMYNQTYANQDYVHVPMYHHQGYPNTGYVVQYAHGPPPPPPTYLNMNDNTNDHMFSDENPNGCFIM
ncbi:heavy metal-associated isoprenylated plant protein 3 isoform X1 [Sesamum indicum]|uniref:Heavy metal-associated isoprenylated plant protein 3 isoform X1 n=1 Tax=Sesamum indicum TaxID=4182 RepID=A0A8M8UT67_SESIN|nr:heavy metal-associated isoprenylated plant protein 3 isoform X1 [Sesamum indicum]